MKVFLKGCIASVLIGALLIFFFGAGFVAHGVFSGAMNRTAETASVEEISAVATPPDNFNVFYEALGMLRNEFYGELPEGQQVPYAAIRGVLARLEDPNTVLVEPVAHEREREQFQGEFGGIGAQVSMNEEGQIVIVSPIPDTPASSAGLRPNDVILEVDGTILTDMSLEEAVELIRGPVGTEVTLLIQRPDEDDSFSVTLTRDKIPDITVNYAMVEGTDIGYIHMSFFSARTTEELRAAIESLREEGARKFALDLRNNPGGLLDAAISTSSLFIGEGVIAYQQRNDGSRGELTVEGRPILPEVPLVVLINEGTASASEILAGALQAYERATLVGTTSFGKGTVQIPYTLSDGSSLHVTVAHWLTPDGIDLSREGLMPGVYVETTEEQRQAGVDPVYEKAIELLEEME
ncbi:MAG: S41 family peptidase [Chloroflexota bacterium]|nr:S41 family peptidase [Chloroflexota bacterium]